MRQIGVRQEAGRIGGIGTCGRQLCCSSWINSFISVSTNAARCQEVSLNPSKMAGQCGKLKCCLNYELDNYINERKNFPDTSIPLQTKMGKAIHKKTDVLKQLMWYGYEGKDQQDIVCLEVASVHEVIEMNKSGRKPEKLEGVTSTSASSVIDYHNGHDDAELLKSIEDKTVQKTKHNRKKKRRR
jgi:cell fate regulator YaaT (PSP1 superfamily)